MSDQSNSITGNGRGGQAASAAEADKKENRPTEAAAPLKSVNPEPETPAVDPVPSLSKGSDPELERPIFRRHKDNPPAAPSGTIIRKSVPPPPLRPQVPRATRPDNPSSEARVSSRPATPESRPARPDSRPAAQRPQPRPEVRVESRPATPRPTGADMRTPAQRPENRPDLRADGRHDVRYESRPEPSPRVARIPMTPGAPLPLKKVETGILALDHRIGGLSVGSVNSLSGVEHSARSHLAVHIAHAVIEQGGRVLVMISPTEEGYWEPRPGLYVDVAVRRDLEGVLATIEGAGKVDLVVFDPMHAIETPPEQDRIAAMDNSVTQLSSFLRRCRTTFLGVNHMVDRATRHQGVSLHPWMFRDVSCLLDVSEVILILRTSKNGGREILCYRRGINNRVGGLPSFVLPWV